jgi:hypothetical protein
MDGRPGGEIPAARPNSSKTSGQFCGRQRIPSRRFHLNDWVSWQRSAHRARFGVDWEYNRGGTLMWNNDPVTLTLFSPDQVRAIQHAPPNAGKSANSFSGRILTPNELRGPPGLSRRTIQASSIANSLPGIPGIPVGTPLNFTGSPTLLTGADLIAMLPRLQAPTGLKPPAPLPLPKQVWINTPSKARPTTEQEGRQSPMPGVSRGSDI